MDSRHRDMRRVSSGLLWKNIRGDNRRGQCFRLRRNFKSFDATDDCESLLHLRRIAERCFVDHHLRNANIKMLTSVRPPLLSRLLVGGDE